jgi:hypothetical protein
VTSRRSPLSAPLYRPDLPAVTERIARLPVCRGYPVPWFVAWVDESGRPRPRGCGQPDFRVIAPDALEEAYYGARCWICGEKRGRYAAFVSGPMCGVNRTSAEPPSHPECAGWSVCACPFLSRPYARRREAGLPDGTVDPAGIALRRNPGVALVWGSRDWRRWIPPGGGWLYDMGTPQEVAWFAEGRPATREEVERSIVTGLPPLCDLAERDGPEAVADLTSRVRYILDELAPPSQLLPDA